MGGPGMRSRLFSLLGFLVWRFSLVWLRSAAGWPQGLLDVKVAMIPEVDGDSTPLGQHSLSVSPVVCRQCTSLRLSHLKDWVEGWFHQSVFSLGRCHRLRRGFPLLQTSRRFCLVLGGDQLHVMVADVIKWF